MQAEVESPPKKADATGWGAGKRSWRVRRRYAEQRAMGCAINGCVFTLSSKRRLLTNNYLATRSRMRCVRDFHRLTSTARHRPDSSCKSPGPGRVAPRAPAGESREKHGTRDRGRRQASQRRRGRRICRQGPPRARRDKKSVILTLLKEIWRVQDFCRSAYGSPPTYRNDRTQSMPKVECDLCYPSSDTQLK